jgi:hypothetical protein
VLEVRVSTLNIEGQKCLKAEAYHNARHSIPFMNETGGCNMSRIPYGDM